MADRPGSGVIASSNKTFGQTDDKKSSVKEEIKFQSGKSLPTIGDVGKSGAPESDMYDFPSLGAGLNNNK